MTNIAIMIGLSAAVLLLAAGYLFGLRAGARARKLLRQRIQQQAEFLRQLTEQSSRRAIDHEVSLRTTIEQVLAPLVERERLSLDLAELNTNAGQRRDLAPLLERIASVGTFTTVLLSNEEGLPLASNRTSKDLDRLAAASTRLAVAADQISGEDGLEPHAIMLRDASGATTLCRLFHVQGQRLSLTAVSNDLRLTSVALDPALTKIEMALATPS